MRSMVEPMIGAGIVRLFSSSKRHMAGALRGMFVYEIVLRVVDAIAVASKDISPIMSNSLAYQITRFLWKYRSRHIKLERCVVEENQARLVIICQ